MFFYNSIVIKMNVLNILKKLENLDLNLYPYFDVKDLIGKLGNVAAIQINFNPGKKIIRARPNYNGEVFKYAHQLSYKLPQYNRKFQRASSPNMSMFYGAVIPEFTKPTELDNARVASLLESIPLSRDPRSEGEQIITYGTWVVTKKFSLYGVVFY